jgi:hypothetical protein
MCDEVRIPLFRGDICSSDHFMKLLCLGGPGLSGQTMAMPRACVAYSVI